MNRLAGLFLVLLLFVIALSIGACGGGSQGGGETSQEPTTPVVTVTPASGSITTAQSLAVTITVSGANGTATGSVVLSSGAYTSSAATLTAGSASITIAAASLAAGSDTLTVKYTPDAASSSIYNSASGNGSVTVTQPTTPAVTVTPASGSITTAQPLAVTITVSGASGPATGSVVLSSGVYTSSAATLTAGSASITIAAALLAVGSDTLIVKYTPDAASSSIYNSATGTASITVTQPTTPVVTITPASGSITTAQPLAVTITVSGASGTATGSVVLSSGAYTSSAATLTAGSASITIAAASLAAGSDTLTVKYTPDAASSSIYNSATGNGSVTVTQAASYLTAPANGATVSPQNTQFTWTAVPGVIKYTLWLGSTPGAQDVLWWSTAQTSNPSGVLSTATTLLPGITYYATLWTLTSAGYTSTASTFQTSATSYLTAPANGATVSPQNIQFTWTAVPGVISYSLWIGTTAGAQDAFYYTTAHLPNPAGTTSANATLLPSTTYYATLGTLTSSGTTFTTSIFTTSATSFLTAPANGATVSPQNIQFTWIAVPGVINYTLWLGSTPGAQDVLWYSTAQTSNPSGILSTATTLLPGITYYATLWTLTSAGYTSTASTFLTSGTAFVTSPENGATNLDPAVPIAVSWTPVATASSYELTLGSSAGANNYYDSGAITITSTSVSLSPNTTYYARIWTNNAGSRVSTDSVFSTGYGLAHLTYPFDGETGVSQFRPFTWSVPAGATSFGLGVSPTGYTNDDFFIGQGGRIQSPNASEYVWALQPNTTYYVQLCTINPGPNGGGCVNSSFTTGPALPNPSDPKAFYQSIQYLTGQVRQMTIGTSNVPAPGTYLYQFIANRGVNPALSTTCGYFAAALLDQFTMNNILARQREVTLNGAVNHVTTEYWDPFNQKWEVADPTFGMVYFDATSAVGQSVEDVSALLAGSEYSAIKSLFVTPYGSLYATSFYMDPVTLYNEPIPFGNYDYSGQMNYLPNSPLPFLNVVDLSVMGTAGVYDFQFANPSDSVVIDNNSSSLTITGQNSEGWTSTQTLGPGWQIVFPIPDGMNLYEFKRILF